MGKFKLFKNEIRNYVAAHYESDNVNFEIVDAKVSLIKISGGSCNDFTLAIETRQAHGGMVTILSVMASFPDVPYEMPAGLTIFLRDKRNPDLILTKVIPYLFSKHKSEKEAFAFQTEQIRNLGWK